MNNQLEINLFYTTIKTPLPDFIYKGIKEYSKNANLYRHQPPELIEKLAKKHNVPKETIFLTAGIDEAIQIFAKAYGKNTYIFTPTYVVYADVELFGGKLNQIPSIKKDKYDVPTEKINDATLIFIANPNNPSGTTPPNRVIELVRNNSHTIVCVDEAYSEFSNISVIDKVTNFRNIAIFRSFSKAYGMAGNRIGYIVSNPEIINHVKDFTQWANVSYLSVGAAMAALDHEQYFAEMRKKISKLREIFFTYLKKKNFSVIPSHINALLLKFETTEKATKFVNHLNKNNVIVAHGGGKSNIGMDKSYVRIAIGTEQQMAQVKQIIDSYK